MTRQPTEVQLRVKLTQGDMTDFDTGETYALELCGFRVVDLFGNFDRSVFSEDSPEIIFVAEKF